MQVTAQNQMDGLEGRSSLLQKLADALKASPEFFGDEGRPGNMIGRITIAIRVQTHLANDSNPDYLEKHTEVQNVAPEMPVSALWHVLIEGLQVIWPSRFQLNGISLGDVWPCEVLNDDYVPFHKLTQWTCYSLLEVIQKIMGWKVTGIENMTGLPEYRNGKTCRFIANADEPILIFIYRWSSGRLGCFDSPRRSSCKGNSGRVYTTCLRTVSRCDRRVACDDCDLSVSALVDYIVTATHMR